MILNWIPKILLSPFALLYGTLVSIRAFFYRTELLRSSRFDVPIINIGNLNTGGTGKSPHIEYLLQLLQPYINVAVLSRGYKRRTEGFRMVVQENTALEVGDEPLQFKHKYPSVPIAVGEKRAYAVPQILYRHPEIQTILLDDALQHLAIKPYCNILLTTYDNPFTRDFLLPAGRLREWRSGYRKADIIIVTKCPSDMQDADKQRFIHDINPYPKQSVFFSYYNYGTPYSVFDPSVKMPLEADTTVFLICAIAGTDYLVKHLSTIVQSVTTMEFEDHRLFTNYDVAQFKRVFEGINSRKKIILTTEKDATRLELHKDYLIENQINIFALPIEVKFHFGEGEKFDNTIKQTLLDFKV